MNTDYPPLAESDSHDPNRFTNHCFGPWNGGPAGLRIGLFFLCLFAIPLSGFADPEAHLKSPLIHLAEVESRKVAFHLMVPEGSPEVLRGVLLHAAHFNARTSGRWYRFCAEHGLAHLTLTEFPSGQRRPRRIGEGIPLALSQFARDLNRPELNHIPVLSTGFSAGGMGDPAMRKHLPDRYLGCANSCSWMVKWEELEPPSRKIPGLFIIGSIPDDFKMLPVIDERYRPAIAEGLPYTLGFMHGCAHNYGNTAALAVPYLEALLELRLPDDPVPPGSPVVLKEVDFSSGWRGNYATVHETFAAISTPEDYTGPSEEMIWMPNRATAFTWRAWQTKDSPVDITISANEEMLHRELDPKSVTGISLREGDLITLGLHLRKEGVSPKKVTFWDEDRKLGEATGEGTLSFQAEPGILHVYAEYDSNGKTAVTNPMQIVIDDKKTAIRSAKSRVDRALAKATEKLEKEQKRMESLNQRATEIEKQLEEPELPEPERKKLRGNLGSLNRVREDQGPKIERLQEEVSSAREKRDQVYRSLGLDP